METVFYLSSALAVIASVLAVTRRRAVGALVWLVTSLLATAAVLFTLGAELLATLEVILYAGAVMVLFVFAVMMLNTAQTPGAVRRRTLRAWLVPTALVVTWLVLVMVVLPRDDPRSTGILPVSRMGVSPMQRGLGSNGLKSAEASSSSCDETPANLDHGQDARATRVSPKRFSVTLFTHYLLAVELAGVLLLTALVGVVHLGRPGSVGATQGGHSRVERAP